MGRMGYIEAGVKGQVVRKVGGRAGGAGRAGRAGLSAGALSAGGQRTDQLAGQRGIRAGVDGHGRRGCTFTSAGAGARAGADQTVDGVRMQYQPGSGVKRNVHRALTGFPSGAFYIGGRVPRCRIAGKGRPSGRGTGTVACRKYGRDGPTGTDNQDANPNQEPNPIIGHQISQPQKGQGDRAMAHQRSVYLAAVRDIHVLALPFTTSENVNMTLFQPIEIVGVGNPAQARDARGMSEPLSKC
ncbi:hypothetical protein C8R47DRAFT_1064301 [Mycena vitilis]|nr:hypothetical protein C8R47DRAFT_1081092 [Mycena vitilis]KAJ6513586.1 hypothetical protein C8R47DRAFT_1064301 [Mycena vitilis]